MYTTIGVELCHARKAWTGTPVDFSLGLAYGLLVHYIFTECTDNSERRHSRCDSLQVDISAKKTILAELSLLGKVTEALFHEYVEYFIRNKIKQATGTLQVIHNFK
jgi:hypothetical protein